MSRVAPLVVAALAPVLLAGCPSSWGFSGRVCALRGAGTQLTAVEADQLTADALTPVPGARVTCDGCGPDSIAVDPEGRFFVRLGASYGAPAPLVIHVSAPGYRTVDLEIPRAPHDSSVGYASLLVVMKREGVGP